ncbi:MAG: ferrous iron transport protein B [Christensenellales bacterium]|jgi:ferrous iron transport protein B
MGIKIALAGNPNSGKTTLFNHLTGANQYVGNWPGVTVERKEGTVRGHRDITIQDLPGIYSLSPYTMEEVISRNYLVEDKPDVILDIVDASNIERNLYLTTQLAELGIPMVIALNMADVVKKRGDNINVAKLADTLGCPVVETTATRGTGAAQAVQKAMALINEGAVMRPQHKFSGVVEKALYNISLILEPLVPEGQLRWYSTKFFERDKKAMERIKLTGEQLQRVEQIITACETRLDDDSESIITNERYEYIGRVMAQCVKKKKYALSTSDKIDHVMTNRILALPIFAAIMVLVYYISISTVGGFMTDWVNEELFGSILPPAVEGWLEAIGTAPWLTLLVLDGIIAGVGAVLGFLPQMATLFLLLAILEDCGYMARIAFILDRLFRRFGLSGKSFIPMLIGTGCGVPGIMASRTIENERDRRMTVITTTFIPCSAKLPIIALIAGAMFGEAWWVAPVCYFIGVAAVVVSGIILKKTALFAGTPSPFVMELPAYHFPRPRATVRSTWDRSWSFVKKAGTIILLSSIVVWFLSNFDWQLQMTEDSSASILAGIGNALTPVFSPLGWTHWEGNVATITGLVAKENVVSTMGVLYGFGEVAEDGLEIWAQMRLQFTGLSAMSFLIFNLLCAPCFAAVGAIRREMNSAKWTWFALAYQTGLAYCTALVVYQLGTLFMTGAVTIGTVAAVVLLGLFLYMLFRKGKTDQSLQGKTNRSLKGAA